MAKESKTPLTKLKYQQNECEQTVKTDQTGQMPMMI